MSKPNQNPGPPKTIRLTIQGPPGSAFHNWAGQGTWEVVKSAAKVREAIVWFQQWIEVHLEPLARELETLEAKRAEFEYRESEKNAQETLEKLMAQVPREDPVFDSVRTELERIQRMMPPPGTAVAGAKPAQVSKVKNVSSTLREPLPQFRAQNEAQANHFYLNGKECHRCGIAWSPEAAQVECKPGVIATEVAAEPQEDNGSA